MTELERGSRSSWAIPFLGRMRMSSIEARDLDELATHIAKRGVKPNTVRLSLAPVKALLATAHQRGELRSNPAAGYRTLHELKRGGGRR